MRAAFAKSWFHVNLNGYGLWGTWGIQNRLEKPMVLVNLGGTLYLCENSNRKRIKIGDLTTPLTPKTPGSGAEGSEGWWLKESSHHCCISGLYRIARVLTWDSLSKNGPLAFTRHNTLQKCVQPIHQKSQLFVSNGKDGISSSQRVAPNTPHARESGSVKRCM